MKVANIGTTTAGGNARLSAKIIWEDVERPPAEVFFDVPREFEGALSTSGNSFLVGALLPAVEAGERRIAIDAEICPRLNTGLLTVLRLFQSWYGENNVTIAIEANKSANTHTPACARAGAFLTGGIDSLATLRRNHLLFAPTHPEFVRDVVLLYGINIDSDDSPHTFAHAVEELSQVARSADATLIPVHTNIRRELNTDIEFFRFKYHGALLAAAAHALSNRLTTTLIASTFDISCLMPWGSHPMLDPLFSSADLRLYHDSLDLSRFEKTKVVAEWETGLHSIKVCPANWPGRNCGKCEKCNRTMLALAAIGALHRTRSFDVQDLTADRVRRIQVYAVNHVGFYAELIRPLRTAGRDDLASAVEFILARYRREVGFRGTLRRFDRMHLGGVLHSLKRMGRRASASSV
jgi:hypothetical protein